MFQTLKNAWKVDEIRKKLIFTLLMLVIFRLGNAIPVPFVDRNVLTQLYQYTEGNLLSFMNLLTGGALGEFTIFAMSIYPYITASIILQLLTIAIPRLEELSKEGEAGQKKIQQYTRIGAVVLGVFQALGISGKLFARAVVAKGFLEQASIIVVLIAGTMFLVWLGDLITEKGIGNGISMLIFAGIISRLPHSFIYWTQGVIQGKINPINAILMLIIVVVVVAGVVIIAEGERRINVQYAKRVVGRKMYGGQATHIPIKVNMGGVMPVIFTSSLLQLPSMLGMLIGGGFGEFVNKYFSPQQNPGIIITNILAVILIILFAFFYTAIQFNTVEYSKNLQQQGGFIPGIRPGRPTSDYMGKISNRITFIGAIALAILYVLPAILSAIFKLPISFGGTAIIIVVGVVLETFKQMESMLLMRHYKGFLNK
ncbi:preprotein translocase subunit SecY [Microaceticoccus formicicus]|uniref:preprotein translocase subunit SecY n=1 Tax=Microaceticoccus formicicus TaxID=3118105 RepID=UPI003CD03C3C|nr:preprotein translocase subunit SecY [Peptoniphilaceae bacterium AMB_02]